MIHAMHWLHFHAFNFQWFYFLILAAFLVAGLYVVLVGAPGLWVMVLATLIYAIATHFAYAGLKTLIAIVLIAGVAELLEFVITGTGAKKAGASRWGMWGAIIGSIIGAIFLTAVVPIPIVGTIFGVCLGTFVGALVGELFRGSEVGSSVKIGIGAATGRLLGLMTKLLFGAVILFVVLIAARPPIFHHKPAPAAAATRSALAPANTSVKSLTAP